MQYELFYLVGSSKEGDLDKIKKEVAEIVTQEGGAFEEKQTEEKRKLSYEVKHESHGIYIAQRFELEDLEKIQEINRKMNLYNGILRFIITKADELPELLSKDERKAKAASIAAKQHTPSEKKTAKEAKPVEKKKEVKKAETKEEPAKKEESKEEAKESTEDIDKKLEEILNI